MKILELRIRNIRGIRNELPLAPGGENLLIFGPNGSGKSSVVDALDFLLTGSISRLTGQGTGDVSQKKHGPHVDEKAKVAVVQARIMLPGSEQPVFTERSLAKPDELNCLEGERSELDRLLIATRSGTHVLTRREILKYITAKPADRAEAVQTVLNINEIEQIRKALVYVRNEFKKRAEGDERAATNAEADVNATLGHSTCDEKAILEAVNKKRTLLGGTPIPTLVSAEIKVALTMPATSEEKPLFNVTLLRRDLDNLRQALSETNQAEVASIDEELREVIATLRSDSTLLKELSRRDLTQKGLALLDESGSCPLCDKAWQRGQLRAVLQDRLARADSAAQYEKKLDIAAGKLRGKIGTTEATINGVLKIIQQLNMSEAENVLNGWKRDLERLHLALNKPVHESYPGVGLETSAISKMMAPDNLSATISRILDSDQTTHPEPTEEQTSWDLLTKLEENLKALERARKAVIKSRELLDKANILLGCFEGSRDKILGDLYQQVAERFVEMYRAVHGSDEDSFAATFQPDGASLNFAVDFYGRGMHPPHALHSEGHQDSMGLCLYLALNEHLSRGTVDLIILDDVVMSVDANHRRGICRLLKNFFPGRQFLITTHDKTWAEQLKRESVVKTSNIVEFYDWQVDTGPKVRGDLEIWEQIDEDLRNNNVPGAAHKLRRGSEQFFQIVCHDLSASVAYDIDGRHELGDLINGAVGKYKSLLKKAKLAANSWDDRDTLEKLKQTEASFDPIYHRVNNEWPFVNLEVHYNDWSNLSPEDFRPVVEAFSELWEVFRCKRPECRSVLRLTRYGTVEDSVTCACGAVNWKLTQKSTRK